MINQMMVNVTLMPFLSQKMSNISIPKMETVSTVMTVHFQQTEFNSNPKSNQHQIVRLNVKSSQVDVLHISLFRHLQFLNTLDVL